MRLGLAIVALLLLGAIPARADHLTSAPELPKPKSLKIRITENVNSFSDDVGFHVGRLTADLVALKFDVRDRALRLRIGRLSRQTSLRFESEILLRDSAAQIDAELYLRVLGRNLHLDIPAVELAGTNNLGRSDPQVRLPIFHTRF